MVYQSFLSNGSPSIGSSKKEFTFVLFSFWGTYNRIIKVYLLHKILFLVDPVPHRPWKIVLFDFLFVQTLGIIFHPVGFLLRCHIRVTILVGKIIDHE